MGVYIMICKKCIESQETVKLSKKAAAVAALLDTANRALAIENNRLRGVIGELTRENEILSRDRDRAYEGIDRLFKTPT